MKHARSGKRAQGHEIFTRSLPQNNVQHGLTVASSHKTISRIRARIIKLARALDAALEVAPNDSPWSTALNLEIINQTAIRIVNALALPESVSP